MNWATTQNISRIKLQTTIGITNLIGDQPEVFLFSFISCHTYREQTMIC